LQPYDQIIVREIPEYKLQQMVYIGGEVLYPGYYAIMSREEKLTSLVSRAGGITRYADVRNARLERAGAPNVVVHLDKALRGKNSFYNYVILPGDQIEVPRVDYLVSIVGEGHRFYGATNREEVNAPYQERQSAKRYVKEFALGFAKKADKSGLYVQYPNGKVDKTKNFWLYRDYPTVKRGGTIYVAVQPEKEKEDKARRERKPFDMNQAIATVAASITSFATLYVLITR
jgi:hypothetical protein